MDNHLLSRQTFVLPFVQSSFQKAEQKTKNPKVFSKSPNEKKSINCSYLFLSLFSTNPQRIILFSHWRRNSCFSFRKVVFHQPKNCDKFHEIFFFSRSKKLKSEKITRVRKNFRNSQRFSSFRLQNGSAAIFSILFQHFNKVFHVKTILFKKNLQSPIGQETAAILITSAKIF